ncbi:hypothetical protein [Allostreptomyces psammosilenae]|uniref:Uncharacterized protein n=1 Tax=Allostreptomyces psammosilenae TaxID=1892865 RepID=A0A852ZNJ8_9ACTN|nr:hypothetical protein [Allostreptomyces psammosilenae]NYI03245.1 hypothetical protein [Allostreptomyces psammosilenae]
MMDHLVSGEVRRGRRPGPAAGLLERVPVRPVTAPLLVLGHRLRQRAEAARAAGERGAISTEYALVVILGVLIAGAVAAAVWVVVNNATDNLEQVPLDVNDGAGGAAGGGSAG